MEVVNDKVSDRRHLRQGGRLHGAPLPLLLLLIILSASLMSGCSSDPAQKSFDKAEAAFADGKYTDALEKYSSITANYSNTDWGARSQYRIALIYNRHLKDKKKALEAYEALSLLYPGSVEAGKIKEELAGMYAESGDFKKALEQYQRLMQDKPLEREKYQRLIAAQYINMNDFKQARVELGELLKITSDGSLIPDIYYQIANTYYVEGNLTEAINSFDLIISKFKENVKVVTEAKFAKAECLDDAGRLNEALEIFKGLMGSYPNTEALKTRISWIEKRLREGRAKTQEETPFFKGRKYQTGTKTVR